VVAAKAPRFVYGAASRGTRPPTRIPTARTCAPPFAASATRACAQAARRARRASSRRTSFRHAEKLLNARGKPYFPDVYKQLQEYREMWRAKNGMTVKAAHLVDAATGDEASEAEDAMDQYHVI